MSKPFRWANVDEDAVWVEINGATMNFSELVVDGGVLPWRFVIDPAVKRGKRFHVGAFFSKAVMSDEVLRYPRSQRVAVLAESPIDGSYRDIPALLERFPIIFTHQQHLLEQGGPFRPLMFGTNWVGVNNEADIERVLVESASKDGLVSFIGSLEHPDVGAYRFRREIAEFATRRGDVECFGKGIRPVAGKREAIAPFMFSIAMENAAGDHYFSEKLIDCLLLETVPIYFGWPSIGKYLDPRGFIQFSGRDELEGVLDRLTPELYQQMRPFALANRERVISERWHNHKGLLERISEQLPVDIREKSPLTFRRPTRVERMMRRLWRRVAAEAR